MEKRAYFLTGKPGSGKTSIIKEVLALTKLNAGGFYTEEIRTQGVRQGFKIITLDGKSATLAHINFQSPYRVSKYGVELKELDEVAVPAIQEAVRSRELVVIDEIGKMELFSDSFRQVTLEAIESGKPILGTIMLKPHPWADRIKQHPAVELILVNRANHGQVKERLFLWIESFQAK